jgi:hypothetical protein
MYLIKIAKMWMNWKKTFPSVQNTSIYRIITHPVTMLQYGTISWVSSSPFLYALFGYTDRRCEERESYISKDPVLHFFDVVSSPSAGVIALCRCHWCMAEITEVNKTAINGLFSDKNSLTWKLQQQKNINQ